MGSPRTTAVVRNRATPERAKAVVARALFTRHMAASAIRKLCKKCPTSHRCVLLPVTTVSRPRPTPAATTEQEHIMKDNTKPTLSLRAHSIRNLTAGELRVVNGGVNDSGCWTSKRSATTK